MSDAKAAAAAPAAGDCGPEGELSAKVMASNTMPICKYGLACRIITPEEEMSTKSPKEEQHWYKFQHPCFFCLKDGHPDLGPPGVKCPLHPRLGMTGRGGVCPPVLAELAAKHQCTNMDPDHRRCFRHPEDDEEKVEIVDEAPDELDEQVMKDEAEWTPPELGDVSEDAAMEAKQEAAEAASSGDLARAVACYSTALKGAPSALTYAKRAEALLKLGHPTPALADCIEALKVNPDSAKTYKVAAKALTKQGEFEKAYEKICTGMKLDYDDDAAELQKTLKAKLDKMKKIAAQRARAAEADGAE